VPGRCHNFTPPRGARGKGAPRKKRGRIRRLDPGEKKKRAMDMLVFWKERKGMTKKWHHRVRTVQESWGTSISKHIKTKRMSKN